MTRPCPMSLVVMAAAALSLPAGCPMVRENPCRAW